MQRQVMAVITIMGLVVLLILVGALVLAYVGRSIPAEIWALAGAATGSLGTLLTTLPRDNNSRRDDPPPPRG